MKLKVKRVAPGVYDATDRLGRVYEVTQNEADREWKIWYFRDNERVWADTVGTLREAKEAIVGWADRDEQSSSTDTGRPKTKKLKNKLLR